MAQSSKQPDEKENPFEVAWAKDNPRPEWDDPEHWARCRPDYETAAESENS